MSSHWRTIGWVTIGLLGSPLWRCQGGEKRRNTKSLDVYIGEAHARTGPAHESAPGSLWSPSARLSDIGADLRASRVDDIVTVLVSERASAVSKGATKSARTSSVKASVDAVGGVPRASGPLPNLARASSAQSLDGQGETTRESILTTSLTCRVVDLLPNGFLVVEGAKTIVVNSEEQVVRVRGVVRPFDLTTANTVRSERLANLEVEINGKGVVGDAVRRPFILYRILLGLLPF